MTLESGTDARAQSNPSKGKFAGRFEWTTAILLTAAVVVLHIRYFFYAGALWRDEVHSIAIAGIRSFSKFRTNLYDDSFPALWLGFVRLYERCGLGNTDRSFRAVGLVAGLAVVGALWRNSLRFGGRTPVVSLALMTFTSSVICFGDSFRGYGLGMFFGILMIGCVWELTQNPTPPRICATLGMALLSVHMLYYNCVLLLAACCGAIAVTAAKGQWRRMLLVLAIGAICAISMLIYIPMMERVHGEHMFQQAMDADRLISRARDALQFRQEGSVLPGVNDFVWGGMILAAIVSSIVAMKSGASQARRDVIIYCSVCLVVGLLGYWGFLYSLRYLMQPWYFLAAMAMAATCLDGIFSGIQSRYIRIVLSAYAIGFAIYCAQPVWENVGTRRTNIDLIVEQLERHVGPDDVIVITPWHVGVSFNRYYHGQAGWMTIPPVGFVDYMRYELLPPFIEDGSSMDPLIAKLTATLQKGHRVWLVENDWLPSDFAVEPRSQNAPDPVEGWRPGIYQRIWERQVRFAIRKKSASLYVWPIRTDEPISDYESPVLTVFSGFKGNS